MKRILFILLLIIINSRSVLASSFIRWLYSFNNHFYEWPLQIAENKKILLKLNPSFQNFSVSGENKKYLGKSLSLQFDYQITNHFRLSMEQQYSETSIENVTIASGLHDFNSTLSGIIDGGTYKLLYGSNFAISKNSYYDIKSHLIFDNYSGSNSLFPFLGIKFEKESNELGIILGAQRFLSKRVSLKKDSDIINWYEGEEEKFISLFYITNIHEKKINFNFRIRDYSNISHTTNQYDETYTDIPYAFIDLGASTQFQLDQDFSSLLGFVLSKAIKGEVQFNRILLTASFQWQF